MQCNVPYPGNVLVDTVFANIQAPKMQQIITLGGL